MRHPLRCLLVLAALVVALAPAAPAQGHPQTRQGFWIGFGFGYGIFSCTGCGGSEGGFSGYLKLGGTLSPNLLLGGETNGWTKSQGGATLTASNASATLYFYPSATGGLFLRGGLGFAVLSASAGGFSASESGVGAVFGAGYDIRVGRNMSIVPVANYNWGKINSANQGVIQLALGLTWH